MTKKIKIGPIYYTVKIVDGLRSLDGTWLHGEISHHDFEIRVAQDHTNESHFVTMWHEVIHGIETLFGFELEEGQVTALASAITQVLQENPGMNWTVYNEPNQTESHGIDND